MRVNHFWAQHEDTFERFLADPGPEITYQCIPWPDVLVPNDLLILKLKCLREHEGNAVRQKLVRKLSIRWHPDKFQQQFGDRMPAAESGQILARVTRVFQLIQSGK